MTRDDTPARKSSRQADDAGLADLYARETKVTDTEPDDHAGERGFCPDCHRVFAEGRTHCPKDGDRLLRIEDGVEKRVGETIADRLTLLGLVGTGGMGTVYRAYQHSMRREVAVKLMHPAYSVKVELVNRFMREAKSASRLAHPNIITLFDFGQTDDGALYLSMELLTGRTLYDVIRHEAPFSMKRARAIICQVCDALHAAHEMGIIHRDIKPENIFIIQGAGALGEFVKVIDFGLATIAGEPSADRLTPPDAKTGTPAYMAPEQILGDATDERTDVYAAGTLLFEMLTGVVPFPADMTARMLLARVTESAPRMSDVCPDGGWPRTLDDVVAAALATQPADRPASAARFKAGIERALGGTSTMPPPHAESRSLLASLVRKARKVMEEAAAPARGVDDPALEARIEAVRESLRRLERALDGEDHA